MMVLRTKENQDQSLKTPRDNRTYRQDVGKNKVVPVLNQAPHQEDVLGSGGIAPSILNLDIIWR
jgi:hypothetical protein